MAFLGSIPNRIKAFWLQFAFVVVLMTITRVIFHVFNATAFNGVTTYDYLVGFWFDCVTASLFMLPFAAFYLLPLPIRLVEKKWVKIVHGSLYTLTVLILIGLNLMDVEYFHFTSKRSTIDLLAILSAGSDFKQLITTFIKDFWYLILFFALGFWIIVKFFSRTNKQFLQSQEKAGVSSLIGFLISIGLLIFIGRGGFVFKPVNVLDASRFVSSSKTALVLNTPFTMVKSIGNEGLKEVNFYASIEETEKYFNPIKESKPLNILPDKTNVVILILESFGKEFIGYYNGGKTYTPFLDSLLSESLAFDAAFANGKKSIEAVPSIFASIPSLLDNPYISSQYNSNRVVGLPELLKQFGYETAFYHGATNGSMRFDSFAKYIGFDHYVGKNEYPNQQHSDKTWGILDEYFNPWTAKQITKLKEPFLASLFTLSSHHPFFVPGHRQKEVIQGDQPLCASISYGDLSLRLFFEEAKKQPWYDYTIFILCADHTPGTVTPFYNLQTQLYQIPMAIYHPGGKLEKGRSSEVVQQIDIYPTILDLLNVKTLYYSFGNSIFDKTDRFSVSYLEGNYFFVENDKLMIFSGIQARNLYDYTSRNQALVDILDRNRSQVSLYEKRLKAIIQRYNHDLIRNKTIAVK